MSQIISTVLPLVLPHRNLAVDSRQATHIWLMSYLASWSNKSWVAALSSSKTKKISPLQVTGCAGRPFLFAQEITPRTDPIGFTRFHGILPVTFQATNAFVEVSIGNHPWWIRHCFIRGASEYLPQISGRRSLPSPNIRLLRNHKMTQRHQVYKILG